MYYRFRVDDPRASGNEHQDGNLVDAQVQGCEIRKQAIPGPLAFFAQQMALMGRTYRIRLAY